MVAKKAGKKPVKTAKAKAPSRKVAKAEKPAPAKKPVSAARAKKSARVSDAAVKTARPSKAAAQPKWGIVSVFGNATGVYGLATDQRIYRWNTRSALWVLHKEGLQPSNS